MALLIKSGLANKEILKKIIEIALKAYVNKLTLQQTQELATTQAAKINGGMIVKQRLFTGVDIGNILASRFAVKFTLTLSVALFLHLDAMSSRTI